MNEEALKKLWTNNEETMKKVRVVTELCDNFQSDFRALSCLYYGLYNQRPG